MIFFISDTHFGHKNIIKYDNRPFPSIQKHDETIISNWNETVSYEDTVYFLGDFAFDKVAKIYDRLAGTKVFIKGNHDKQLYRFCKEEKVPLPSYLEIEIPDEDRSRGFQSIVLCHYPIAEWNRCHHGAWHLYGHTHGNSWYDREFQGKYKCLNVGAPCIGYTPISYEAIKHKFAKLKNLEHH